MAFLVQIEFCVYGVMVKVSRRRHSLLNAALSRKQMLKIVAIILVLLGVTFYFLKLNAPEAKEWLKENRNKYALAGNRFAGTKDAIKFVDKLYELGAVKVVISKDSIYDEKERVKKEGGPYADAIVVTLPNSKFLIQSMVLKKRSLLSEMGLFSPKQRLYLPTFQVKKSICRENGAFLVLLTCTLIRLETIYLILRTIHRAHRLFQKEY